jgi:hypothetical protein
MSSGPDNDNKVKSITMLVRALIGLTVIVLVLVGYLLFNPRITGVKEDPEPFGCGVVYPADYMAISTQGRTLFKANCSSCHTLTDKNATGPGLKGVLDRIPGGNWKYTFIRYGDSLFAQNDPYTLMLDEKWKSPYPHRFPHLSNEDIDAIFGY